MTLTGEMLFKASRHQRL